MKYAYGKACLERYVIATRKKSSSMLKNKVRASRYSKNKKTKSNKNLIKL